MKKASKETERNNQQEERKKEKKKGIQRGRKVGRTKIKTEEIMKDGQKTKLHK